MEMNIDPAVIGTIMNLGWILTEIIIQSLVDNVFAKIDEIKIKEQVNKAIIQTLRETASDIPGFEVAKDDKQLEVFLSLPVVIQEFKKLLHPKQNPEINTLIEEWEKNINKPIRGNIKLLIELTVSRLSRRLWEIPELNQILHIKETHTIHEKMGEFSQKLTIIESKVANIDASIKEDIKSVFSEQEKNIDIKLDTCKELLNNSRPNAALSILMELENSVKKEEISVELRFRMITLIGGCYYAMGQDDYAIERFDQAYDLMPNNPKAITNAALSASLEHRWSDAKQLSQDVIEKGDSTTSARAILIIAIANERNFCDLEDLIDEEYFGNYDYVHNLGIILLQAKQYAQAEKYFRLSLALNSSDIRCRLNLAQIILITRLSKDPNNPFLPIIIDKDWHDALDEAQTLVNKAFDEAKKGDNNLLIWQTQTARSSLLAIKGEMGVAKSVCDEVLSDNPDFRLAIHNRASYAAIEKDFGLAIDLFERLPKEYQLQENVVFSICRSYLGSERINKAKKLIHEYIQVSGETNDLRVLIMQAWINIKEENFDDVNQIIRALTLDEPTVQNLIAASEIEQLRSNFNEAVIYLEEAFTIAPVDLKDNIGLHIGGLCYDYQKLDCAYDWFKKINIDFAQDQFLARAFVQSAYASQDYAQAYETAKECREKGIFDPALLNLEAWLAEYLGDLNSALKLERELVRMYPENISFKVQLARLLFRTDSKEEAIHTLGNIDVDNVQDPFDLMQIAEIYSFIKEPNSAIHIAYDARRKGINNPEIHLAYIFLFMRISDSLTNLEPNVVEVNTAIKFSAKRMPPKWIKLIDLASPEESTWEFSTKSSMGSRLIGHKVGDTIAFREGPLEELTYKIDEIQSIYVRAYQESFEEFSTRFPDHPGLQRLEVIDRDFTKFFTFIFHHSQFTKRIYSIYETGALSIEQFALLIGKNYIDVYASLQSIPEEKIFASTGTPNDQINQKIACEGEENITLSMSGFLTIAYLDLLTQLVTRFKKIYVTQRFIDELEKSLLERYFDLKKGRQTVGYIDERPYFEEFSPLVLQKNVEYIEMLLNFSKSNFDVIPIPIDLIHFLDSPENPSLNIGNVSISTILIARHTNTSLFADDKKLREYAQKNHNVGGFWSQILLQDLAQKEIIDYANYSKACVKLLWANYFFISLNTKTIMQVIKDNQYSISPNVRTILTGLRGPELREKDALNIAREVLKKYWLGSTTEENRILILDEILRNLCFGRNIDKIVSSIMDMMEVALLVAPYHQEKIKNEIENWYRIHRSLK